MAALLVTALASPLAAEPIETEPLLPSVRRVALDALPPPFHTESARNGPTVVGQPPGATLAVPPGFTVSVFADGIERPRWLALTPAGDVLVAASRRNRIHLLGDDDGDGRADRNTVFAEEGDGLWLPFGMAFSGGDFLVANTNAVLRFGLSPSGRRVAGPPVRIAALPGEGYNQHWTRNLLVAPDGERLFVTVGSESNVSVEPFPRASVVTVDAKGGPLAPFASGLRNPTGMALHPVTGELYVTVNERDGLGDDLVPDYLTRVRKGEFFGWPYTYLAASNLDPRRSEGGTSENPALAATTRSPDVLFEAHAAALGVAFYTGARFPERYRGGAFVAFRGSWNRSSAAGYKLVYVPFGPDHRPLGYYEDFLTGFVLDRSEPTVWGRPVDILVAPDGSLLFTDEPGGRVYRVAYGEAQGGEPSTLEQTGEQ